MDDSTPVEPRTKVPFEMDDQSFVSSDTYQADFDAVSQFESPGRSASGRWHTTNSSNTMELERHLSARSVSNDTRANKPPSQLDGNHDKLDLTNPMSMQSEGEVHENDHNIVPLDLIHDSYEKMEPAASMPAQSHSRVFGNNNVNGIAEGRHDSSEIPQSKDMTPTPFLDSSLTNARASRGSHHPYGTREQQEPASLVPAQSDKQTYGKVRMNSFSDPRLRSRERTDPDHLTSTSGLEHRGRSPSPRPNISAETKARWAMLKQLAGVSQPHYVEEDDRIERRDEEIHIMEVDTRAKEEPRVRESSRTGDFVNDASIEQYLQKLQGDPHIDSRGLREGLSRMQSYKDSHGQQDEYLARLEGDVHSGARRLSEDPRISGVQDKLRRQGQDARDMLHIGEGAAEQALRGPEADLRRDQQTLGAGLQGAGRRADGELRSASHDARGHFQKGKQDFNRDVRRDVNIADAKMRKLGGQTAEEFRRGELGLKGSLQGAAYAAEMLLPHTNVRQELRRGEQTLMGDIQQAENSFSGTGLGQEMRKGETDMMGEVHKLEHEFPHTGLGQEIRNGEANLMGDIHKVDNKMANTGVGREVQKGEHLLVDDFHKIEHDLPHLGLGQDLRRGEHKLEQGLHEVTDYLHRGEQASVRGAEAAGRDVKHGAEHIGKFAAEGAAIAGGLGMMALDHAESEISTLSPKPNVPQAGQGMINPNALRMPSNTRQLGAGAPGPHLASNVQRSNQAPMHNQNRPSTVEPSHHAPNPQMSQPSHDRRPSSTQQPHLSPNLSSARAPSPGTALSRNPLGRTPSPSPGNKQRSQTPVRKPVLPPRSQESSQQRPSTARSSQPQPQPQHPPQPQHLPQPQHPQGAQPPPPQPQHSQGAQSHPRNITPQHPQAPNPQGTTQPQSTVSQHPPPQHSSSAPHYPLNAMPPHPQAPQRSRPPYAIAQQPQPFHPQGASQQRQPASAMPQHPPQGPPKQRSQSPMLPDTQPSHSQRQPQQGSQGSMPRHPKVSNPPGAPQQGPTNINPQPQPQRSQGTPQPRLPEDRSEREAQRPQAMPNVNMQQDRGVIPGTGPGSPLARLQPRSKERPISEGKADEQEPRASIMQERKRRAAESQRRMADRQKQPNGDGCRHEDHDAEFCPYQTERDLKTERAEEPRAISGPQSMLNMFKARADAAIEASSDCPSFTDRESQPVLTVVCSMG